MHSGKLRRRHISPL